MKLKKNIQLSEKLQFLMALGTLNQGNPDLIVFRHYEHTEKYFGKNCLRSNGQRLLDFVNWIVEEFGLYPILQKFVTDNKEFQRLYLLTS